MLGSNALQGYSKALFEIGLEEGSEATFSTQLETLYCLSDKALVAFVDNPAFTDDEKKSVLTEIAQKTKVSETIRAFLILVALQGRMRYLKYIIADYKKLLLKHQNKVLVKVTTAIDIDDSIKKDFEKTFKPIVEKDMELECSVDPNILGGAIVQFGSQVYDGSVKGKLNQIKNLLSH